MKRLSQALAIASFVVLPLVSHAAYSAPLTRAQVRADLISAEQHGSFPLSKVHYPEPEWNPSAVYVANKAAQKNAQDAANNARADAATVNAYGAQTSGSSASGSPPVSHAGNGVRVRPQVDNLYRGH
ncbi:DUF4148 domain-containing protein [Paraburkholderia rhizosphaerae]|uniref:Uncharacterized protein DUF4148 n=1 Tax=Paraburkholderia rhizosphaerae TaxID=480658 RepID=A0A4R8L849_9BURK|nr:DUF4148 domain-containing protein [Paraburkholderia rhizosphaerae]TDY38298.1 uncharacterized protein DUF4148 [Paraburkholderia rhizosphaerae]